MDPYSTRAALSTERGIVGGHIDDSWFFFHAASVLAQVEACVVVSCWNSWTFAQHKTHRVLESPPAGKAQAVRATAVLCDFLWTKRAQ